MLFEMESGTSLFSDVIYLRIGHMDVQFMVYTHQDVEYEHRKKNQPPKQYMEVHSDNGNVVVY